MQSNDAHATLTTHAAIDTTTHFRLRAQADLKSTFFDGAMAVTETCTCCDWLIRDYTCGYSSYGITPHVIYH